jgi:hypothetical protein
LGQRLFLRAAGRDDRTAIKVTGGEVEAVTEGDWKLFNS